MFVEINKKSINGKRSTEYIKNDHSIALMIDQRVIRGTNQFLITSFNNYFACSTCFKVQFNYYSRIY